MNTTGNSLKAFVSGFCNSFILRDIFGLETWECGKPNNERCLEIEKAYGDTNGFHQRLELSERNRLMAEHAVALDDLYAAMQKFRRWHTFGRFMGFICFAASPTLLWIAFR